MPKPTALLVASDQNTDLQVAGSNPFIAIPKLSKTWGISQTGGQEGLRKWSTYSFLKMFKSHKAFQVLIVDGGV